MPESFTHLKEEHLTNYEWAKEVRARLADLNELLQGASTRDIIVAGTVAMVARFYISHDDSPMPQTITITMSERL
jgi:hypothetical protein